MNTNKRVPPRVVPGRDEFYISLALWVSSRSKDPKTQVGSVLVAADNSPLSTGYNGPPKRIDDEKLDWGRPNKYLTMIHAEVNAIKHARGDTEGATLYVTGKPCPACMLSIVNAGISRVVWFPIKAADGSSMLADPEILSKSDEIAKLGGVVVEEYKMPLTWMRDRMIWMEERGVFG